MSSFKWLSTAFIFINSNTKTAVLTLRYLRRTHYSESIVFITDLGKKAMKWVTQALLGIPTREVTIATVQLRAIHSANNKQPYCLDVKLVIPNAAQWSYNIPLQYHTIVNTQS